MGGCYDYRYESECSRPVVRTDPVETLIKKFYASRERKDLCDAYKQYLQANDKGFIRKVAQVGDCEIPPPKEFPNYELESKLNIAVHGKTDLMHEKTDLTEIMDAFEFLPSPTSRYLKDASNLESTGLNHFFGTGDGEERLVIIEKKGKWYLKEKGAREPYSLGIPGEEYVIKRPETRVETNPLEVAKLMAGHYADGKTAYQGVLTKNRAEAHLLQTISGRIYSLTVDELIREDKIRMLQFEVEYAGYIPKFKPKLNDERAIVGDIVAVIKQLVFLYNGLELPSGQRLLLQPTQERKFDFVSHHSLPEEPKLLARGK